MVPHKSKAGASPPKKPQPSGAETGAGEELFDIIHKLNQPLTAISNYAQAGTHLIDNGMADTARLKELFEKIVAQSARTLVISQELSRAAMGADSD